MSRGNVLLPSVPAVLVDDTVSAKITLSTVSAKITLSTVELFRWMTE